MSQLRSFVRPQPCAALDRNARAASRVRRTTSSTWTLSGRKWSCTGSDWNSTEPEGCKAGARPNLLDANALFGDLPGFVASQPSSVPPPYGPSPTAGMYADIVIVAAPPPTLRRRQETTARSRPAVDPMRARLIAIITCGSVALIASLGACFLYASTPSHVPPAVHAAH